MISSLLRSRVFRFVLVGLEILLAGVMSCRAADPAELPHLERTILLDHRYLDIPVKAGAPRRTLSVIVDGRVVRATDIELAEGEPDLWTFTDVSAWLGKKAVLRLEQIGKIGKPEFQKVSLATAMQPQALDAVRVTDEIVDLASLYHEPDRPQFHFTTRRGWLNDPNGPLYDHGEYHLFYQYQPFSMSSLSSDKSWGHTVSRDLVHWEELPVAIYPDEHGGAWSGSTLIDTKNVAGFQSGAKPAWLLYYTSTGRSAMNPKAAEPGDFVQRLAYSNDRGLTWTMFTGNPVMKNVTPLNRDPLVFWHEPSKRWVMVLYVGYPISNPGNLYTAQIFNSENLKDWTYQSRIEGFFDCPVLFELPLDGNAANTRWIIHCGNMKYRVGRFDGKTFTPETDPIDSHLGKPGESAYTAQVFRNTSRALQICWLYNQKPGARQMMTFPCDIALVSTPSGPRLRWQPVGEIETLYGKKAVRHDLALGDGPQSFSASLGRHLDVRAEILPGDAKEVEINVCGIPIVFHPESKELTVPGYSLTLTLPEKFLQLRVLLDVGSLEIFADGGLVYLPVTVPAPAGNETTFVAARGGSARARLLDVREIKSIWPKAAPLAHAR
ncbi:MAG: hypothetical protein JWM35_2281 [Verrucomicrobia bacterium]|nr:hypothetical protein [Verrucomicrobiota bacterium]